MIAIYKVTSITKKIQGVTQKTHANHVWMGVIDVAGTPTDVILKQEAPPRLVKELLAVDLATRLGVPHITGWAASVDQATMQAHGITSTVVDPNDPARRLLFASMLSTGTPLGGAGQINQAAKNRYLGHTDSLTIMAFDELVGNVDRVNENVMEDAPQFLAFDHDKILFGDKVAWSQLPGLITQHCMLCLMSQDVAMGAPHTKARALALAVSWAGRLTAPMTILQDLVIANLLTSADAQLIETFLIDRLPHLPALVEKHYP